MIEMSISPRSVVPFAEILGGERIHALEAEAARLRTLLGARAIWNINSTVAGGGVSEMLRSILRYTSGLGVAARWLVVEAAWRRLPDSLRRIVHLALLPMEDSEENAAIVNALQRHAAVIVQKSLHEGFGLTVTEALWKRRPVVASAVGGIVDQINDNVDDLLVHDPTNLEEFASVLRRPLADRQLFRRLGEAALAKVRDHYLSITALEHWVALIRQLLIGDST